jgi:hypothetical protein
MKLSDLLFVFLALKLRFSICLFYLTVSSLVEFGLLLLSHIHSTSREVSGTLVNLVLIYFLAPYFAATCATGREPAALLVGLLPDRFAAAVQRKLAVAVRLPLLFEWPRLCGFAQRSFQLGLIFV